MNKPDISNIVTPDTVWETLDELGKADVLAVDLETTGLYPFLGDRILGVAVASAWAGYYFPFGHSRPQARNLFDTAERSRSLVDNLDPALLSTGLGGLLNRPGVLYVGHNYKFDLKFLAQAGVPLPERIADTRVGASLWDENGPQGLKPLSDRLFGPDASAEQTEIKDALAALGYKGKDAMAHLDELDPALVGRYAVQDVYLTLRLYWALRGRLGRLGLNKLWREYNEYLLALTRMELRGVAADPVRMADLSRKVQPEIAEKLETLREITKRPDLNPNSPKQVCAALGVPSSEASTMEYLAAQTDDPRSDTATALLEYRKVKKLDTTYLTPYQDWVGPDGAIHPDLYLGGAKTGRLSCREPNLQQIPREADTVKSVFKARPGTMLVEVDYEQAELRLASHLAGEERMIEAFLAGDDPHQTTADQLGIGRTAAKTINFGIVYGMGAVGLSTALKIPEDQAREYLERFHQEFPAFRCYSKHVQRVAEDQGYVRLWTGRLRRFPEGSNEHRKAFNSLIQGGAAEIMRRAITRIDQGLTYVRMLLTVHDSILFEAPPELVDDHLRIVSAAMTADNHHFSVPQDVEAKVGDSWGTTEVYDGWRS